jgi:hypothetical protein
VAISVMRNATNDSAKYPHSYAPPVSQRSLRFAIATVEISIAPVVSQFEHI